MPTQLVTGAITPNTKKLYESQSLQADIGEEREQRLAQLEQWNQLETRTVRTDQLCVGDIIKVQDDEVIPADCFILASGSELEAQSGGQCFIATSTLDGERNLKPKIAIKEVQDNLIDLVT